MDAIHISLLDLLVAAASVIVEMPCIVPLHSSLTILPSWVLTSCWMYEGAFVEKDNVAKSGEAAGCTFF
jgi:hypothetical protein